MIPVIDLFAGPGGLCEGFSQAVDGEHPFKAVLSIEKDEIAHRTLTLRAFVHYFMIRTLDIPDEYYKYVNGIIDRDSLFDAYPDAKVEAESVAWCAELGGSKVSKASFDARIRKALAGRRDWLLIGGPPCQAYSLAGRSRSVGMIKNRDNLTREEAVAEFNKDPRQRLYRQYLRIIAVHAPAVFVMENVAGMLSAKVDRKPVFPQIINDLKEPSKVARKYFSDVRVAKRNKYRIYSFVTGKEESADNGDRFLIRAEDYGVPQRRHRVILLGIREDFLKGVSVGKLERCNTQRTVEDAIRDLPKMKSVISKKGRKDGVTWEAYVAQMAAAPFFAELDADVRNWIIAAEKEREACFAPSCVTRIWGRNKSALAEWYDDPKLLYPLNHEARSHMATDLWRYLFVSAYGAAKNHSPVISDFPRALLPAHANINLDADDKAQDFADRFKVQIWGRAASTVTSHISKDGHYFIHPDPAQCRSLSVREAARLQSFPDNYFFEGNRTQQYHQVGNAVPPYLANQLAEVVYDIFKQHLKRKLSGGKPETVKTSWRQNDEEAS